MPTFQLYMKNIFFPEKENARSNNNLLFKEKKIFFSKALSFEMLSVTFGILTSEFREMMYVVNPWINFYWICDFGMLMRLLSLFKCHSFLNIYFFSALNSWIVDTFVDFINTRHQSIYLMLYWLDYLFYLYTWTSAIKCSDISDVLIF